MHQIFKQHKSYLALILLSWVTKSSSFWIPLPSKRHYVSDSRSIAEIFNLMDKFHQETKYHDKNELYAHSLRLMHHEDPIYGANSDMPIDGSRNAVKNSKSPPILYAEVEVKPTKFNRFNQIYHNFQKVFSRRHSQQPGLMLEKRHGLIQAPTFNDANFWEEDPEEEPFSDDEAAYRELWEWL